jgi:hypothetical protein
VNTSSIAIRAAIISAVIATLGGCGTSRSVAHASDAASSSAPVASTTCAATVVDALGRIAQRVYDEGVSSERTATAVHLVTASLPLRQAVQAGDAQATRTAERALLATGHMTNLKVMRGGRVLAAVGGPHALAPLSGTLTEAAGTPIATFLASVWADSSFISEITGIDEGSIALRAGGHSLAGSFPLPRGELSTEGSLIERHVKYRYTSFPVAVYPAGELRAYVLRSYPSIAALCGHSREDALVNTVSRVAENIYTAESGRRAQVAVRRVQRDQALLRAVAAHEPFATQRAIEGLLNHHIVRLRVSAGGRLLSDVGGPYVLAPVRAPLRLGGHTIGSFVLSIQDDEGYKRLSKRLAGVDVLMYMGSELVKNSLGPNPGDVPSSGTYHYRGLTFRVYTFHAQSFPSGPLKINVLIPIPYT